MHVLRLQMKYMNEEKGGQLFKRSKCENCKFSQKPNQHYLIINYLHNIEIKKLDLILRNSILKKKYNINLK